MSQITTHVLDTARGKPAADIAVELHQRIEGAWHILGTGVTNQDGRVASLLNDDHSLDSGSYRLHFKTEKYLNADSQNAFYPFVEIVFHISEDELDQHFHIPLLLSPFGYSTYRGS